MRWVRREELPTLEFPPADAELIQNPDAGARLKPSRSDGSGSDLDFRRWMVRREIEI